MGPLVRALNWSVLNKAGTPGEPDHGQEAALRAVDVVREVESGADSRLCPQGGSLGGG
jgi:hypothetical protein